MKKIFIFVLVGILLIASIWAYNFKSLPLEPQRFLPQKPHYYVEKFDITDIDVESGIATDGRDFWLLDLELAYRFDSCFHYQEEKFSIDVYDEVSPSGIVSNGTDFWVLDSRLNLILHFDPNGNYLSNFNTGILLSASVSGFTTNGTDFWLLEEYSTPYFNFYMVHHYQNEEEIDSGLVFSYNHGISTPTSWIIPMTTNGTDFWIITPPSPEGQDNHILIHYNSFGQFVDEVDLTKLGLEGDLSDMVSDAQLEGGTPRNFWILDKENDQVYHLSKEKLNDF